MLQVLLIKVVVRDWVGVSSLPVILLLRQLGHFPGLLGSSGRTKSTKMITNGISEAEATSETNLLLSAWSGQMESG